MAGLARVAHISSVLELGSGAFSTPQFLDRRVFPALAALTSLEDDADWLSTVAESTGSDPRLDLRLVQKVCTSVPNGLDQFDLIFIDDSRTFAERSQTIRAVLSEKPRGLVAIHDFEHRAYRKAAKGFDHRFTFKAYTPQVAVCWIGDGSLHPKLSALHSKIVRGSQELKLAPSDTDRWAQLLSDD
ncbi:hypothetical protein [Aeromicrobium halocynthiae]|uniref:hypothetical protein n=1 Tax=Aeromicrobium halocynthiae TaxID=560557 RepID=UPI0031D804E3